MFPISLPPSRVYEVVSLHMCVLPYKYRKILKVLPKLTELFETMGRRPAPWPVNLKFKHRAFFVNMARNLDLRCVWVPAPWVLAPKHVSNPGCSSLRHIVCAGHPGKGWNAGAEMQINYCQGRQVLCPHRGKLFFQVRLDGKTLRRHGAARGRASRSQITWLGFAPYVLYGVEYIDPVSLDAALARHSQTQTALPLFSP